MKDKQVFFNPFRLISPKLDAEASRLNKLYASPPEDITCLEEGLLVMLAKLYELSDLTYKSIVDEDKAHRAKCGELCKEVHDEEKALTNALVCSPMTTGDVLKALLLFPGKLERCGDYFESMINVAEIKARDGVPFSDKAIGELQRLFGLLSDILKNYKDLLVTLNPTLLKLLLSQHKELAQMTFDFSSAHEDRLLEGICLPKASSLYLDIMDSVRNINRHLRDLAESLDKISQQYKS